MFESKCNKNKMNDLLPAFEGKSFCSSAIAD